MNWIDELKEQVFSDEESIKKHMQTRFSFACSVFQALQEGLNVDGDSITEPIVYGVIMSNKCIYIGQSLDSKRRIKDLPIGESHHLAKTIPPELWEKIVIIKWREMLQDQRNDEVINLVINKIVNQNEKLKNESDDKKKKKALEYIGKAFEYKLQNELNPLFNTGKKITKKGAIEFKEEFKPSKTIEETLKCIKGYKITLKKQFEKINEEAQEAFNVKEIVYKSPKDYGCAVFPNLIWENSKHTIK
ncbi:hypothetical protein COL72_11210 [Bacillus toyonensis]|uniref:hypothetical protein n=1 Tax=Bacillus toyonensis TaxID=155322 RepID=UPI000BF49D1C|nr:hypothetical protein [Bacillus toyonensis]PFZ72397.1 hypothetical protein COL72_11210 [Bacillus toyonensis]